jgi:sugar phosphate isomerase/epimerase
LADSNRLAPGWGHINFKEILIALKNIRYPGAAGFEILPKPNDAQAIQHAIKYVRDLEGHCQVQ